MCSIILEESAVGVFDNDVLNDWQLGSVLRVICGVNGVSVVLTLRTSPPIPGMYHSDSPLSSGGPIDVVQRSRQGGVVYFTVG